MTYGEFKTQYHVRLNPQQEAAVRQVDGPVLPWRSQARCFSRC